MSESALERRGVHLLPAGAVFEQGCYPNTPVAVCGEPVISEPDNGDEDSSYCPDCVSTALRWNDRPEVVS